MTWQSTKTIAHSEGVSACFRQWRAEHSHCRFLHGYALAFTFVFEADTLDARQWVVDFGSFKPVREYIKRMFDHKLVIAADDPAREHFLRLQEMGLAEVTVLDEGVGCERFAAHVGRFVMHWLNESGVAHARLVSVECREHESNSAVWKP